MDAKEGTDMPSDENAMNLSRIPTSEIIAEYEKRKEEGCARLSAAVKAVISGVNFTSP